MLGGTKITALFAGETLEGSVCRGAFYCSCCGAWMDELIGGLNGSGYYSLVYADDIATLISGKFPNTISELLQDALSMVQHWCDRTQLLINP